eukprot:105542_1
MPDATVADEYYRQYCRCWLMDSTATAAANATIRTRIAIWTVSFKLPLSGRLLLEAVSWLELIHSNNNVLSNANEDSTTDANHDTATILDPATAAMLSLLNERRSGISVMSD